MQDALSESDTEQYDRILAMKASSLLPRFHRCWVGKRFAFSQIARIFRFTHIAHNYEPETARMSRSGFYVRCRDFTCAKFCNSLQASMQIVARIGLVLVPITVGLRNLENICRQEIEGRIPLIKLSIMTSVIAVSQRV